MKVFSGSLALRRLWGRILPCLFWPVEAQVFLDLYLLHTSLCLCLHMNFFSLLSPLFCLIRAPVIGFRAHRYNPEWSHLEIINLIISAKTLFQIGSHLQILGIEMWIYLFGGHYSVLCIPHVSCGEGPEFQRFTVSSETPHPWLDWIWVPPSKQSKTRTVSSCLLQLPLLFPICEEEM